MATDPVHLTGRPLFPGLARGRGRTDKARLARREVTVSALIARCFGAARDLPAWLLQPALTLEAVARRERPLALRLHDLTQVLDEVDDLFAVHLSAQPWFQAAGGVPSAGETVTRWVDTLFAEAAILLRRQILPDLMAAGLAVLPVTKLDEMQRGWLHQHFSRRIYPLLTPLAVDPGRPFPFISSASLNLLVELRKPEARRTDTPSLLARVKVPTTTPRLIPVPALPGVEPCADDPVTIGAYVCAADVVRFFVHHLFPSMPVRRVYLFRVVRGERSLPGSLPAGSQRPRREESRPVVRLDAEQRMDPELLRWLIEHLRVPTYAVARHDGLSEWACLPNLASAQLPPCH